MKKMQFGVLTDRGRVRECNEDAARVLHFGIDEHLAIVADGVGGLNAGELASALAVQIIGDYIAANHQRPARRTIEEAVKKADSRIFEAAKEIDFAGSMATTAVLAWIKEGSVWIAHVGDSRAYWLTENTLEPLTRDHTWVEQMVADGVLTRAQAEKHPNRNAITRALGVGEPLSADIARYGRKSGQLLLCSDGLSNMLSDNEMIEIISSGTEAQKTAEALVKAANDRGGRDNITAVLVDFKGE